MTTDLSFESIEKLKELERDNLLGKSNIDFN